MTFIFRCAVAVLFSPLVLVGRLLLSVNTFQLMYLKPLRLTNRTPRLVWVTPVGTWRSGVTGILDQFVSRFPAVPAASGRNRRMKPGGTRLWYFDRKGLVNYVLVVRSEAGEYRQRPAKSISGDDPTRFDEDHFVIEDWEALEPVPAELLAAALRQDPNRATCWVMLLGVAVLALCWWVFC